MKVDYSPEAIDRRLRQASGLRDLCLALAGPRLKWDWRRTSKDVRAVVKEPHVAYDVTQKEWEAAEHDIEREE